MEEGICDVFWWFDNIDEFSLNIKVLFNCKFSPQYIVWQKYDYNILTNIV